MSELVCPRCGNTTFTELDCGPDSYDDDVTWTSYVCTKCELWYSDWTEKWLVDCTSWRDESTSEEYKPPAESDEGE